MSATLQDIQRWLVEAKENGATHLIVALDTFNYNNYPVYVSSDEDVRNEIKRIESCKQRIDEVYNMSMDIDEQLSQGRVYNIN